MFTFFVKQELLLSVGCLRMVDFTISVGNSSDIGHQTQCAYHDARVLKNESVTLGCQAVAQYVWFKRKGGFEPHLVTICEFVVMGHPARTEGVFSPSHCPALRLFFRLSGRKNWNILPRT